ncbi:MAG: PucR family transcriptional regulator ligand-binding domain-containing protein [Bacillota bacterium]
MKISVSEALALKPFRQARVLAGSGGLERKIGSVTVMDTPDIARWLKGNEMLLCNLFVLKDDPKAQVGLISDLAAKDVACLALKLKRFVDNVPKEMLDLADELDLPIIEMPGDIAWIEVITPVFGEILNRQAMALERSVEIHKRFTTIALKGDGVQAIASSLSQLIQHPVTIVDGSFQVLCHVPFGASCETPPISEVLKVFEEAPLVLTIHGCRCRQIPLFQLGVTCLCCDAMAGDESHASVLLWLPGGDTLTEDDNVALEQALTVTALEMMKTQAVSEVALRFQRNFLFDLLTGTAESRETVLAMAGSFGWQLDKPHFAVAIKRYGHRLSLGEPGAEAPRSLLPSARRALALEGLRQDCIVMDLRDIIVVLMPSQDHKFKNSRDFLPLGKRIAERLAREAGEEGVCMGVGRVCQDVMDLNRSYSEARRALSLGQHVWGRGAVTHHDDLGTYRVLSSVSEDPEALAFYRETLGPVVQYDRRNGANLLGTLETFFLLQEDVVEVARSLFVHPNTVRYRLKRVCELTGVSLHSSEGRLNLQVALKIHHMMQGKNAGLLPDEHLI